MVQNTLKDVLTEYENQIGGRFKPDTRFYNKVGINQKRFGQLIRGEKPLLGYEARNLSEFFNVPLDTLI